MRRPHARRSAARTIQSAIIASFAILLLASSARAIAADDPNGPELLKTDSFAPYVHRLTLYDEKGAAISPKTNNAPPYSPRTTCGKCHPYAEIAHGWHFNAPDPNVPAGRPGEPWIYVDKQTGTILPLSDRGWPGTFKPADIGLTAWDMVLRFGAHTPGGGYGEQTGGPKDKSAGGARWIVSGPREVDCMYCHSVTQQHDPAEAAHQLDAQNFKWAPTVALGLAAVRGEARKATEQADSDFVDPAQQNPDRPEASGPKLTYDKTRFDADDRVLFEITRRPSADRCYFCHTVRLVGANAPDDLVQPRDIHLGKLLCVDCHRNELSHMTTRGYPDEWRIRKEDALAAFTCEGCHLGPDATRNEEEDENDRNENDGEHRRPAGATSPLSEHRERDNFRTPSAASGPLRPAEADDHLDRDNLPPEIRRGGRYGAPRPQHRGLPPLHFEKLTCTACHSGPWPGMNTVRTQTALAHGIGLPSRERHESDPPLIVEPVFFSQFLFAHSGEPRLGPQRVIWPSFWGVVQKDGKLKPLAPEMVRKLAGDLLPKPQPDSKESAPSRSAALDIELVKKVLARLAQSPDLGGQPVRVENGDVRDASGIANLRQWGASWQGDFTPGLGGFNLEYRWPLAHDVRPASQALGAGGCTDCHGPTAPMYFGYILPPPSGGAAATPSANQQTRQFQYRAADGTLARYWALGFATRPYFKWFAVACTALLTLVLLQRMVMLLGGVPLTLTGTSDSNHAALGNRTISSAPADPRVMRLSPLEQLVHVVTVVSVLILGATAHLPKLRGAEMEHWWLYAHMLAAGPFLLGLTGAALLWSRGPRGVSRALVPGHLARVRRCLFWCIVLDGIIVTASVLVAMYPWFGMDDQNTLRELHDKSSLVFIILMVVHTLASLAARGQKSPARA